MHGHLHTPNMGIMTFQAICTESIYCYVGNLHHLLHHGHVAQLYRLHLCASTHHPKGGGG